jgi:hypothetical protein
MRKGRTGWQPGTDGAGADPFADVSCSAADAVIWSRCCGSMAMVYLFAKRLERGRFVWPQAQSGSVSLTAAQLSMLPKASIGDGRCARFAQVAA